MTPCTQAERDEALAVIASAITRCEKIQPKFAPGSAQHSLLRNRLRALYLCQELLAGHAPDCTREELLAALPPVQSILHKASQAQRKYAPGTRPYQRFAPLIRAMQLSQALLEQAAEL